MGSDEKGTTRQRDRDDDAEGRFDMQHTRVE